MHDILRDIPYLGHVAEYKLFFLCLPKPDRKDRSGKKRIKKEKLNIERKGVSLMDEKVACHFSSPVGKKNSSFIDIV